MKSILKTITLTLPLLGASVLLGNPGAQTFSSLEELQQNLAEGEALLFSGEYLSDAVPARSTALRHQVGMSFAVEEGTHLKGFVVHLAEDLPEADRDWSLRLWRFGDYRGEITRIVTQTNEDGEEIEVEETVEALLTQKTGNQPYGAPTGNRTTEGSLAVSSSPTSAAFSAGDFLVLRLDEPVPASDTNDFWYGFAISVDDGDVRIVHLGGNPNPSRFNGFEQLNANTWRSTMGGGNRIVEFDVIVGAVGETANGEQTVQESVE